MNMEGNKEVQVIRKSIIEVTIPGENAVVLIETDANGGFIKAYDEKGEPIKNIQEGKEREKNIPAGTLKITHSSPYCIIYYDPWRGWVKICSPGSVC